ncbi:FAD-dependent monooxygenase [Streptomyces sp. MB09-01]|uniref:FAD-dependent monooxygenase n=1 Tax=Streptomyces sp. MB09-01 TaxID=3028666 RepID=UPI0029B9D73A|nr:FAD-dependent monooxygenase [Streptomyces sp. MB09-01]MDX3534512.1 FAD-dependent monooxygenase [Streptomyces sp. MB09-01]
MAGDPAHALPIIGGLGMNTGISDVHNPCWKLAGLLRGWAGAGLLGTHATERQPARATMEHRARRTALVAAVFRPARARTRGRPPLCRRPHRRQSPARSRRPGHGLRPHCGTGPPHASPLARGRPLDARRLRRMVHPAHPGPHPWEQRTAAPCPLHVGSLAAEQPTSAASPPREPC